jgi:DNA polymerase III delta prime subunit
VSNLDIRFIENLSQRLKVGSRKSVYLNAVPGKMLNKIDLKNFDLLEAGLSKKFLSQLLSSVKLNFSIRFPNEKSEIPELQKLMRRISNISIDNKDYLDENGIETFAFGYPILLRRDSKDPRRIVKAPLVIWSLSLRRNWQKVNEWIIERDEDYSIVSNFPLASYIFNDAAIKLNLVNELMTDDGLLDGAELASFVSGQMERMLSSDSSALRDSYLQQINENPLPIPENADIDSMELKEPVILWSGIFGLFKTQKESIINDLDLYKTQFGELKQQAEDIANNFSNGNTAFIKHTFSLLPTDPSQQQLLHSLGRGENLVIQGPPGTGKSQTLTGIISNVISNGGRCLVVCEKKTAMDVLLNNLKQLGLGELSVIVEDLNRDRTALVNAVRERMKEQYPPYTTNPNYLRLLQNCAGHIKKLQQSHEKLLKPICGIDNWSDLVTNYLILEKDYNKDSLNHLKVQDFSFAPEELNILLPILRTAEELYRKLGTLQHPFNAFVDRFFTNANSIEVFEDLKKSIASLLYAVDAAQRDLLTYLYQYEKLLEDHYTLVLAQNGELAQKIINSIAEGLKISTYFFNKNGGFYRSFLAGISSKYKKLKEEKASVLKNYAQLQFMHQKINIFRHDFLNTNEPGKIIYDDIKKNTEQYYQKLSDWYGQKEEAIRDFVNNLSEKNIHPKVNFAVEVKTITRNLDLFEQNFEDSKVFKVAFRFKNRIIRDRLNNLEELDKNIKSLDAKFASDFEAYHALKFFWLNLNASQQAAITGLAESGNDQWDKYFESWYRYRMLTKHADNLIPEESSYRKTTKQLDAEMLELRRAMHAHTLHYWRAKQTEAVAAFNRDRSPMKVHSLYNLRGNSGGRRTALRQIFETDPNLFTSFYPVLMLSPSVAASMLPLFPGLFDAVIFDEASQLRLEDTFAALCRARFKIVSGDSQQMPPSDYFAASGNIIRDEDNEEDADAEFSMGKESVDYLSGSESLLEYCISEGNYRENSLKIHYRSEHPYLIDFSNTAFYGGKLVPVAKEVNRRPIIFHAINSQYDLGLNRGEAIAVVERLLEIYKDANLTQQPIPSMGVATFNLHQRNLILEMMQEYTMKDPANGLAFETLFNAGLFVKNLENIQGDERDVILISTTFGPNATGSFIQNFGHINRQLGYRLLNVIITRAKQQLEIYTSIPANYYIGFREHLGELNSGKGLFYAYLAYAKAVSEGDETGRKAVLKVLSDNNAQFTSQFMGNLGDRNLFVNFVADKLSQTLSVEYRVSTFEKIQSIEIPILIKKSEKAVLAVFTDLYSKQYSQEAYAWDIFMEKRLIEMGIRSERVWSLNCWQNLDAEISRLLHCLM